jgi:hypothetical protein
MKNMTCLLIAALCYFNSLVAQQHQKLNVLFLGNSYTYVNNLPQLISDIALANGDTLVFDSYCPGGKTFQGHSADAASISKINAQAWSHVILQAQSQEPSFSPLQVNSQTLPYAIKLDSMIQANNMCTETVFYETWGRKNGDSPNCGFYPPVCTYTGMQNRLRSSYKLFADTTRAIMSPAGEAWRKSIALNPSLELYSADESHPSLEGSYLTACVFYEVLFHNSVLTNTYSAGIATGTVSFLQQIAHDVVNDSLITWNVGKYPVCVTTSVKELDENLWHISVFPNPANNLLYINSDVNYKIYDLFGHVCLSGINSSIANVANLRSGIYFIEIDYHGFAKNVKFMKE